jgi:integrase
MATVKFYPRRPKENGKLKTTEVPVFLVCTIDKKNRFELTTFEKVPPAYWNFRVQEVKPNFTGHIEVNASLAKIKKDILQLWRENKSADINTLKDMARPLVKFGQASAPEKKTLLPILQQFINQYKKDKDIKTVKKYQTLYNKIEGFRPKLGINQTDHNFYDEFKNHLFDLGNFDATVYKTFTNLKTFLSWAAVRGHEIHRSNGTPSHEDWEIIKRRYPPVTLTMAELEAVESVPITPELIAEKLGTKKHARTDEVRKEESVRALEIARDYFVMECRTGQRISDLKRFNMKNLDGFEWTFYQKKGNRLSTTEVTLPFDTTFTRPAWLILEKYNFQLPKISEQKLNKNIKKVCHLAGLEKEMAIQRWKQNKLHTTVCPKYEAISTHTGRKTFITLALQFMPPKLVKDLAGIESYETLKHYEGKSEKSILKESLNKIKVSEPVMRKAQ